MATPNTEQKLAIEHSGGVLLKAGAGSGKTFVLKEHLIYLTKNWILDFKVKGRPVDEFPMEIKSHFRKIVMMTFTKKAAGELAIRLNNEFEAMIDSDLDNSQYWSYALENLAYLTVSTIHGFCFKLIKQGFFAGVSVDDEMLSETEFNQIITNIFSNWITSKLEEDNTDFVDFIIKDKVNITESILNIFGDPTLRKSWQELDVESLSLVESDKTVASILDLFGHASYLSDSINLGNYSEFEGKKYYDFLVVFEPIKKEFSFDLAGMRKAYTYFEAIDFKLPQNRCPDQDLKDYFNRLKLFKDFIKSEGEQLLAFEENFETIVKGWFLKIKELIDYVSDEYEKTSGFTFGDLEYIVYMGLQDPKCSELIQEQYSYFIVDEFQDTSFIQFEILEKLIGSQFSKLFCVGDLKQAIYGFRGGELGVFLECEKKISKNLSLKNNYRSDKSIIDFNNEFFEDIFKRGFQFSGIDENAVPVEKQNFPDFKDSEGEVYSLDVDLAFLDQKMTLTNIEVDYLEALALSEQIESLIKNDQGQVAVLYKRLKPSLILFSLLIEKKIGFTAQIKIPFGQDPIVGIFASLIEYELNTSGKKDKYICYVLKSYFALLEKPEKIFVTSDVEQYFSDKKYFGVYHALYKFLFHHGVNTSNFLNNLSQIKVLIREGGGAAIEILNLMKRNSSASYSLDFQYGENSTQILMMTAHASKGLQFPNVLLGGMYTNENSMSLKGMIGKVPLSFKWSKVIAGKEKYKTPEYLLEAELTKRKDFSETKRLFYVANTRAENTLGWVNLDLSEIKRVKKQAGSWINGINICSEIRPSFRSKKISIEAKYNQNFLESLSTRPPIFHLDNLGTELINSKRKCFFIPELSVTKLAEITECPRRFYLQNICKISKEEMSLLEKNDFVPMHLNEDELSSSNIKIDFAARGTEIHEALSEIIKSSFDGQKIDSFTKYKKQILWTVDNLRPYLDKFELISERSIKFELFNYMISGIPDLIVRPKATVPVEMMPEIWDFKTGKSSGKSLESYWLQLLVYAYAEFAALSRYLPENKIRIVLCFVDEEKILEQFVSKTDVDNLIMKEMIKIQTPEVTNKQACEFCPYNNICQK